VERDRVRRGDHPPLPLSWAADLRPAVTHF
jgi:hypothetical protein